MCPFDPMDWDVGRTGRGGPGDETRSVATTKEGSMRKLQVVVFAMVALALALLPGISAARIATNHNLARVGG